MALFVFGGSFNPPHLAHVLALCLARAQAGPAFEEAWVVPTYRHAFGKELAPFDDRVAMAEAAMGWIPGVHISRIEEQLGGESRTLHTLQAIRRLRPDQPLRLLVGADILAEKHAWLHFDQVEALAPLFVLGRAGGFAEGPEVLLPALSSTEVRRALRAEEWPRAAAMLPAAVLEYVRHHHLYAPHERTQSGTRS